MTDDLATHHLGRGVSFEQQGDLVAAEREYSLADKAGSADGASTSGVLLKRRGDYPSAEAAYRRSEARGDARFVQPRRPPRGSWRCRGSRPPTAGPTNVTFPAAPMESGSCSTPRATSTARSPRTGADELGDADGAYSLGFLLEEVVTSWEQRRHSAGPTGAAMPVGRRRAEGSCATEAIRLRRSWRSGGPTSGATPTVLTSLALCSTSDRRSRERCRRSASSGTGSCRCSGGHQAAAGTGPRSATPRAGAATSSPTATFTCLGCVAGRPRRCGRSRQERHRLGVRDAARALGSDQASLDQLRDRHPRLRACAVAEPYRSGRFR